MVVVPVVEKHSLKLIFQFQFNATTTISSIKIAPNY